jgi:hypothetical protein
MSVDAAHMFGRRADRLANWFEVVSDQSLLASRWRAESLQAGLWGRQRVDTLMWGVDDEEAAGVQQRAGDGEGRRRQDGRLDERRSEDGDGGGVAPGPPGAARPAL